MPKIIKVGQKEVDLSFPYSEAEMQKAYDDFISDAENKGEKDSLEKELSQARRSFFFSDPLILSIRILNHLGVDIGDFDRLEAEEKKLIFNNGGISLLASIFQKDHGLTEAVAWSLAVKAVNDFGK